MPYRYSTAANSLLQRAFKEDRSDVTPMKLQKLLWFLNGWHLAITGQPAVREPFEAWKYGPVLSSLYRDLKSFGGDPITKYVQVFDEESNEYKSFVAADSAEQFYEVLDLTWEKYIGYDAIELSAMTHVKDSPWRVARKNNEKLINSELIKSYFIGLARAAKN